MLSLVLCLAAAGAAAGAPRGWSVPVRGTGHAFVRAPARFAPRRPLSALRGGASVVAVAANGASVETVATLPIDGQRPGTSGVRKRTAVFMEPNYVENLVQAFFDTLGADALAGSTLVVGGDGRFFCAEAAQTVLRMALANGVGRCWVGVGGLIATPAVSALIRERDGGSALCGVVLTASHNPGGADKDFGLKFNVANGGPAPEPVTDAVYERTRTLREYRIAVGTPDVDLSAPGARVLSAGGYSMAVEVLDTTADYAQLAQACFDLPAIGALVKRADFRMVIDAMHGAAGPYLLAVLGALVGCPEDSLVNCTPLPDFGGVHPDPNLTYAPELVRALGLTRDGTPADDADAPRERPLPAFGAACDGDGDRNMILGERFFVTPSDSLAVIAAHAHLLPQFERQGGLRAVARSMPTGGAVDRVAAALGIPCFETPSGWKFFGNLMDAHLRVGSSVRYSPLLCGEESFGTGSDHVREKDGVWAILAWLSILAAHNRGVAEGSLVTVAQIVSSHWATYGRNFYTRHDYEEVSAEQGAALVSRLQAMASGAAPVPTDRPLAPGAPLLESVDEFEYTDPTDGSVSRNQGIRCLFHGGARAVFRLSGTGSVGATVRLYVEKFVPPPSGAPPPPPPVGTPPLREASAELLEPTQRALAPVVQAALALSQLREITGRQAPDVVT